MRPVELSLTRYVPVIRLPCSEIKYFSISWVNYIKKQEFSIGLLTVKFILFFVQQFYLRHAYALVHLDVHLRIHRTWTVVFSFALRINDFQSSLLTKCSVPKDIITSYFFQTDKLSNQLQKHSILLLPYYIFFLILQFHASTNQKHQPIPQLFQKVLYSIKQSPLYPFLCPLHQ